jgi:hypothetical protein
MKRNIHYYERFFRFLVGAFITSLAFWGPESPWYLLGLVAVATSLAGYCPLYSILGISTIQQDNSTQGEDHSYFHPA